MKTHQAILWNTTAFAAGLIAWKLGAMLALPVVSGAGLGVVLGCCFVGTMILVHQICRK